jgi:hypothetical protein
VPAPPDVLYISQRLIRDPANYCDETGDGDQGIILGRAGLYQPVQSATRPSSASRGILSDVVDQLRAAAEALSQGDPEPLASLFAEDAEWRGLSRGHLWWKHTPS